MTDQKRARAASPWASWLLLATLPAQGEIAPTLLAPPPADEATATLRAGGAAGVAFAAREAVVKVVVRVNEGRTPFDLEGPSTGVVVHPSGLVVTWWSSVQAAEGAADKALQVQFAGRPDDRLPARLVAHDEATGLALLQIVSERPLAACAIAAGSPRAGEPAIVMACPEGKEHFVFAGVVTPALGGVVHRGRPLGAKDVLLTDARIDLRCEGAACFDAAGRLLGLCSSEHVRRDTSEPTLAELKSKSFGFVLPAAAILQAFGAQLKPGGGTPGAASAAVAACARAARSVVGVWRGDGRDVALGTDDPFAERRRDGVGSGVVLSRSGLVVTNAHLLGGGKVATVVVQGRRFAADVVKVRGGANLALLQVRPAEGLALEPIDCGDSSTAILGETVLGIGNPTGGAAGVTAGVLSALREGGVLQADPDLGNQNGGGALVDVTGRLLGIVDGGVVDRIDRAFAMEGPDAKIETNLSFCVGVDAMRRMFADELESAAAEESVRQPAPVTAAERALRTSPVAQAVARTSAAMLNVYISRVTTPVSADDNPFADHKPVRTRGESLGSGVIVTSGGLALTNWHVVDAATEPDGSARKDHVVQVQRFDGKSYDATVLSISREDDLALLQLQLADGETVQPVELGDADALLPGETVIAIGNPHGEANTITAGVVAAKGQKIRVKGRWAELEHLIETDAAINGGNSGGALLDLAGRLVGINSAGSRGSESRGYAIAVDHVRQQVLSLLLTEEKLRSPALGLHVAQQGDAVIVHALADDGPAVRAGLAVGDRLLALDGVPLTWVPGYALALRGKAAGQPVRLRVAREGRERELEIVPLAHGAWQVFRQTGIELAELTFQQDPEAVRAGWTAAHRKFVDDERAEPSKIEEQAVRIVRLHPRLSGSGLQAGDLLLGAELPKDSELGKAHELRRFLAVADAFALFQDRELGSYDGVRFPCWVCRGGKVVVVEVLARRVFW